MVASYFFPADCGQLLFDQNGADGAAIRQHWQALEQCGSVDGDALRRADQACAVLRVRMASARRRPGYPPRRKSWSVARQLWQLHMLPAPFNSA